MAHSGCNHHPELLAVAHAAVIFPPIHFASIGTEIRAADMMVDTSLRAAQPRKEALSKVRAALAVAIGQRVIDPLDIEATMQDIPVRGFVGMDGAARITRPVTIGRLTSSDLETKVNILPPHSRMTITTRRLPFWLTDKRRSRRFSLKFAGFTYPPI
jgi:hypothetical protein